MATLASTLVGTFTASMGLYDRVSDKRQQHKQRQRDTKQDGEIKELRDEFKKAQQAAEERQQEIDRLKSGGGGGDGRGRRDDDVGYNLGRDAAMVQRMYDDGFGRYGNRFAQGDGTASHMHCLLCEKDTDCEHSYRRESAPSADHLAPTNCDQCPPRRTRKRPTAHPRRPSKAYCGLQCCA